MHARLLLLSTLLALNSPLGAAPWTLAEAVATALRQHPDALSARHRVEAADAMLQQAEAAWRPQVSLSGGYTESNSAVSGLLASLNQRDFSFARNFNRPGWVDDFNVTGTAVYTLYRGGQPTAQRNAARAGTRAAQRELESVRLQLAAETARALLALRRAREVVTALEAGVRGYEATLANARLRFEAGQLLKADLLSLEVQLARTREQLSSARHHATLAARLFQFVLGVEGSAEPVELAEKDPGIDALEPPSSADVSQRPEVLSLQERVQAAEATLAAARGGQRPTVNAFVSAQYDHGWRYARSGDSVTAGLTLDFNVFDGGLTNAQIRQASANLAMVRDQLRKASLQAGLEAEQARLAHASAVERMNVTSQAVAQAEESATLSRARFERGALLAAELIGTESRLTEMRISQTLAAVDERTALVDLRRALGLLPVAQP